MEEQLVLFETAVLAKEREFDELCLNIYDSSGKLEDPFALEEDLEFIVEAWELRDSLLCKNTHYESNTWISAPTQALLQKWLREKHNLRVNSDYYIFGVESTNGYYYRINQGTLHGKSNTYEEALEQGLQEALKLI